MLIGTIIDYIIYTIDRYGFSVTKIVFIIVADRYHSIVVCLV